ncbi:MAG TPA: hypothetical protein VHA75_05585, partial [Rugosimonospora sp.]|nr:hypothetical protein [Rugosimonospora sp.]
AAGKVCPTVTPARVAAQLMAASGFQANLLGPTGAQGIAQFLPEIWTQYGTGSPWDTAAAIPALGSAMCDLVGQLSSLGADPYQLALAAFGWGTDAVRQAGAVPRSAGIQSFISAVTGYADAYATDPALSSGQLVTKPQPGGSATSPAPASPTPGKTTAAPRPSPTNWLPLTVQATTVLERGQAIQSTRTRLVMQNNGDLAIYDEHNQLRWTSGTSGRGGDRAVFQADGNLVVYDQNWASLWTSNTPGHDGAVLVLEADGNVCVVYQGAVIWAANTAH